MDLTVSVLKGKVHESVFKYVLSVGGKWKLSSILVYNKLLYSTTVHNAIQEGSGECFSLYSL